VTCTLIITFIYFAIALCVYLCVELTVFVTLVIILSCLNPGVALNGKIDRESKEGNNKGGQ
jgi:hypothetical protein